VIQSILLKISREEGKMSTKANKELIREHVNRINEANQDVAKIRSWCDKIYARGYVCHYPFRDMSREETIESWASMVSGFPGFEWSTEVLLAEDDRVVNISTIKGTHKGIFIGIPATGKQILIKWVTLYKIGGGKILEGWEFPDMLSMMVQLGVIPSTVLKT
jgi:predicted ester cyclase